MPVKDVLIRAQELGGRWTVLGSDSARGITVEDLNCDSDTWGSRGCSFTLRRNGRVPWPDIGAFAPIEIESQGLLVWAGRVKGTPTTDGSDRRMTINGEGWQYHLDDDSYAQSYVRSNMTDFVDSRSLLATPLAAFSAGGQVQSSDGVITISWPSASTVLASISTGVTLDFGTGLCSRVVITYQSSNNYGLGLFYCRGGAVADGGGTGIDAFTSIVNNAGASGTATGTFASPQRYVSIFMFHNNGSPAVAGADIYFKVTSIQLFANASWESGNASILKASDVIRDARTKATLLLSSDTSKITATTFNIPDFAMSKPDTPRNVINAVNTYHSYQSRVTVDKLLEYRPQPANPAIQVDARSEFDEASAGDASEIYSGVSLNYAAADGSNAAVQRTQVASAYTASAIQPTNPGAEVNTTNWTGSLGTLTRTTVGGEFSNGVGGFKVAVGSIPWQGLAFTSAWTGGSFIAGRAYRLTADVRADVTAPILNVAVYLNVDGLNVATGSSLGTGAFQSVTLTWVQPSTSSPVLNFFGQGPPSAFNFYFDNILLSEGVATVVDRRGFRRTFTLDTNMSLTPAAAQQIGDVFLTQHKTTPLKGKVVCSGYGAASKSPSGVNMPPAELLLNTGELVRLAHLIDPDTGNIGREGRIAAASWDAASDTTTLELDSQVNNFEAFLGRLGILTGAVK